MAQTTPSEVYATLVGAIDTDMTKRVCDSFIRAHQTSIKRVHLFIQSTGGLIGEGIAIYNFLRNQPVEVIAYNPGTIGSIAIHVFLGADHRKASRYSTFFLHQSTLANPGNSSGAFLRLAASSLELDDKRTDDILRQHATLSPEQWDTKKVGGLTLSADEALKACLIDGVEDWKPSPGASIFTI